MIEITPHNLKHILQVAFETDQSILFDGKTINSEIQKKHEEIVKNVIDNFGFISIEKYGEDTFVHMCLLVQHLDNSEENLKYRLKYLKLFEENFIDKNSDNAPLFFDYYALIKDRFLIHSGKKQIYGTQVLFNPDTNKYELEPVDDLENLNQRRIELKLVPIEKYLENFKS